ncbi:uncharacterized protein LOC126836892 isoform X1 [Adelges cooleyi]|uniref:uncharacterized protein LOC126836892 isoform X1 n=1 Tax=Adelges cooleyi TaxID=133065 RepID=UPI0021800159|nr:uncharacterized protein LOC126836892 isoform X1 [Adelges cooleyi]
MSTRLFNMFLATLLILFALIGSINCGDDDDNPQEDPRTKRPPITADLPVDIATPDYNHGYDYTQENSYHRDNSGFAYGTRQPYYPQQTGDYNTYGSQYYDD